MNKLQKTIFFWAGIALAVILAVYLAISANQKLNTATNTNVVSFTGEGKIVAKPDISVIDFSIVTENADSQSAQNSNSEKSNKITDFLKKQGIEDKDIKTTSYNIYPQYGYPRPCIQSVTDSIPCIDKGPQISGYQVNQSFQVKVRDLAKSGSILKGVVSAGANQVNNLGFQIDDPEKLKAEARAKAIADAKLKANELREQLGIKLGRIINFSENFNGFPTSQYYTKDLGGGGLGGAPSLPTGENEVNVSVTITYQIK